MFFKPTSGESNRTAFLCESACRLLPPKRLSGEDDRPAEASDWELAPPCVAAGIPGHSQFVIIPTTDPCLLFLDRAAWSTPPAGGAEEMARNDPNLSVGVLSWPPPPGIGSPVISGMPRMKGRLSTSAAPTCIWIMPGRTAKGRYRESYS